MRARTTDANLYPSETTEHIGISAHPTNKVLRKERGNVNTMLSLATIASWCITLSVLRSKSGVVLPDSSTQVTNKDQKIRTGKNNQTFLYPGLKAFERRNEIGSLLEEMHFKTGVEVGVQTGRHAAAILRKWKSCENFKLVDLWAQQENYKDPANVNDKRQMQLFETAKQNLAQWGDITEFYKMLSVDAAERFDNESFDFVYIDARHDYCGVTEDIRAYWGKVKPGGVLSGHDYKYAKDVTGQDWSMCANGTHHPGAVRGAVEDFAVSNGLTITVEFGAGDWKSWMVQKPWV